MFKFSINFYPLILLNNFFIKKLFKNFSVTGKFQFELAKSFPERFIGGKGYFVICEIIFNAFQCKREQADEGRTKVAHSFNLAKVFETFAIIKILNLILWF